SAGPDSGADGSGGSGERKPVRRNSSTPVRAASMRPSRIARPCWRNNIRSAPATSMCSGGGRNGPVEESTTALSRSWRFIGRSAEPIQHGGGGPGLLHAAQRLAGERLVVLGETAVGGLAQPFGAQRVGPLGPAAAGERPGEQPAHHRPDRSAPVLAGTEVLGDR